MCLQYRLVALAFLLVHSLIGADGMMYDNYALLILWLCFLFGVMLCREYVSNFAANSKKLFERGRDSVV